MKFEELLEVLGPDTKFQIITQSGALTEKAEATRQAIEKATGWKCVVSYADCPKCGEKVGFLGIYGRDREVID